MFKDIGKLFLIKPENLEEKVNLYKELNFSNFIFFKEHFEEDFDYYISFLKRKINSRFLAVDQEGGRVCRIEEKYASPLEIAKKYLKEGEKIVSAWAKSIANSVKRKGLNLNLAPCVDLADETSEEFLKGRTFGKNPKLVKELAYIFITEHKKEGVFTCLKHFPGLKDVKTDPHKELPLKETLDEESLYPYKYLFEEEKIDFIMTTHLCIKEIDSQPATFSSKIINILRKDLNYKGAILTDDLNMGALKNWELQERIILSLASGHNLLIYCGGFDNLAQALEDIKSEIEKSSVLRERIKENFSIFDKIEGQRL
ncbi:MAG: glycoside hydrolase family 3 protein [Thermodesulfobacterium sp.]|nr:glycoside hydrolase family 3 protein [Thermodesulfobacterium sp.]